MDQQKIQDVEKMPVQKLLNYLVLILETVETLLFGTELPEEEEELVPEEGGSIVIVLELSIGSYTCCCCFCSM